MTIVDASQRSRPRLFQPQFLLEGFQRLAGSLNGLGRSVFRLLSCYRAVLQEGGTSILSRPCAFFRHCCCCLSTKPFHHLSPIVCSLPRHLHLVKNVDCARVCTAPNIQSTLHLCPSSRSFALALLLTSPRARTPALISSHAVAHLPANTPSRSFTKSPNLSSVAPIHHAGRA